MPIAFNAICVWAYIYAQAFKGLNVRIKMKRLSWSISRHKISKLKLNANNENTVIVNKSWSKVEIKC